MNVLARGRCGSALVLGFLLWAIPARAEEGMWLFNRPPSESLFRSYGFRATPAWLQHLQRSSVRMDASGSLVSPRGLLLTNHHVGIDQVERLSTPDRDLLRDGFYAPTEAEELPCPGLRVQILDSIVEVTAEVIGPGNEDDPGRALEARQRRMTRLEEAARRETGRAAEVVSLFQGARYDLYLYREYDDVRLVFAPEERIANFGEDVDNFEYPRHAFDVCFFRIYDGGRPLSPHDWLRWSRTGVKDGVLVFAAGHPYETQRQMTREQYRTERDWTVPGRLRLAWRQESKLLSFAPRSPEHARSAHGDLLEIQNWRKATSGALAGLLDPKVARSVAAADVELHAWVLADPDRAQRWGRGWELIDAAQVARREIYPRARVFGRLPSTFESHLFRHALVLVELAEELPRPSEERRREFRDSELEGIRERLLRPETIFEPREIAEVESGISWIAERLGGDDTTFTAILGDLSPRELAAQLVRETRLDEPDYRRALLEGGPATIRASRDPMVLFAARLAPLAGAIRRETEQRIEGPEEEGEALLAAARWARDGETRPPDATNTLRLSYGTVKGYVEDGAPVDPFTTLGGLYGKWERNGQKVPFSLPDRWIAARPRLSPETPMNFVSTLDTVGGSSGSPVVDAQGELVGLVFDGNIQSLVWDYAWEETQARCLAVDARAIVEVLRVVYGADALADELVR